MNRSHEICEECHLPKKAVFRIRSGDLIHRISGYYFFNPALFLQFGIVESCSGTYFLYGETFSSNQIKELSFKTKRFAADKADEFMIFVLNKAPSDKLLLLMKTIGSIQEDSSYDIYSDHLPFLEAILAEQ